MQNNNNYNKNPVSSKGIALFFHTSQSFLRDRDDEPTKRSRRLQFAHLNFRATTSRTARRRAAFRSPPRRHHSENKQTCTP